MITTIYIAGPMRGYPNHNIPAFRAAASLFRERDFVVVSPVELGDVVGGQDSGWPPIRFLRNDLQHITLHCNAMALLPGWQKSTGARCEASVGVTLGFQFFDAVTGEEIPAPSRIHICGGYERAAGAVESLDLLSIECTEWANATFPKATQFSRAEHLRREAVELLDDPNNSSEMADVFMLLGHLANHAGVDLAAAVRTKLEENRQRTWGEPDHDGVVEHVRSGIDG